MMIDIEYEEHEARMKTIALQQDVESAKLKLLKRKLEICEEEHALKMENLKKENRSEESI